MRAVTELSRGFRLLLAGRRRTVAAGLGLCLLQPLATLAVARIVQAIFDVYLPARDHRHLLLGGLAILGLLGVSLGAQLLGRFWITRTVKAGIRRLRENLFAKLHRLPRGYYDQHDKFRLHDTLINDTERFENLANALLGQLLPACVVSGVLGIIAAYLNAPLFALTALVLPLLYWMNRRSQQHHRASLGQFRRDFSAASRGALSSLRHIELSRLHGAESQEQTRQNEQFRHVENSGLRVTRQHDSHLRLQHYTLIVLTVLILIVGGIGVTRGQMTLGALLAYYAVVSLLANSLREIAGAVAYALTGYESLRAVLALADLPPNPLYSGTRRLTFSGRLALRDVTFAYPGAAPSHPVLDHANLELNPGTLTVLVGPNGAGKSTVLHLLLGFYRPQHGTVVADGQPFDELDLVALRHQIGVVTQEPVIFEGEIRDNLVYGHPDATEEMIVRAARLATAHDFIVGLPAGYATLVGDAGTLLSGGQRQRIALARALLRQPTLLIFDEPTNHLDGDSTVRLLANLRALSPAPAMLVVTHHTAVIRAADAVYQVSEGTISPLPDQSRPAAIPGT